jgi:hypothetical protein
MLTATPRADHRHVLPAAVRSAAGAARPGGRWSSASVEMVRIVYGLAGAAALRALPPPRLGRLACSSRPCTTLPIRVRLGPAASAPWAHLHVVVVAAAAPRGRRGAGAPSPRS